MTIKTVGAGDYRISSDYLILLTELGFERGISASELLKDTGLPETLLFHPDVSVGHESALKMLQRFCDLTNDLSIALEYGKRMTLSKHGALGFAAQYSETMVDAAQKVVLYIETRIQLFDMKRELDDNYRHLSITPKFDHPAGQFLVLAFLSSVETICRTLVASGSKTAQSTIYIQDNTDLSNQTILANCTIKSGSSLNRLTWPRAALEGQLSFFNPNLENLAENELKQALHSVAESATLSARVREILLEHIAEMPTVDTVASTLCMSAATLNRKLKAEQRSFQQIKDSVRYTQAQRLLKDGVLSIDIIAEQLGYSDASNFAKAFKGWSGQSPSLYRQEHRQEQRKTN
ncbi:MAG: helix-turn-helix domain-containing protein [Thalassolituus sp.]|jgi:AraC-like DNA-binding protein|uniref:HTH araC/xylS-type domain-containing protein n=2 Tax=root TaxID=1 RepID=M5DQ68_9GAMM|nr:AraC family transcriptional regulator [Thalassolituus oleivorans]PCI47212.1 MAG: AraC family transcriptional regulator [Oceanospirillales bacterium]PHQ87590.1 MAG: AraC family transcriptional regulator [Thalassobium sp.]AHK17742.1 hypothetical protein R615_12935 [Thalassolituus oleivorans R6-15]APR67903.1 AraC family transcriptional regulator [Thalassolituus oleivorans]MCA6127051.1 hypothetical protein [Thalassolituus oleivorans 4BN06-13]